MFKIWSVRALFFVVAAALVGCQTPDKSASSASASRAPNSVGYEFDSTKVGLLKWAAQNRILFQFPDAAFEDVAYSQTQESCKSLKSPAWSDTVFAALTTLKKNNALQNKVHVIEIKRGEKANAEITKDLDGLTYLILHYARGEKKSTATQLSDLPCETKSLANLGEKVDVTYTPPASAVITKVLKDLPARSTPDRWNFKTEFLQYLAQKMTVLRYSAELGFERSAQGDYFFVQFLNDQAQDIAKNDYQTFDYWLSEISQRSHAGGYLKIFALMPDKQLSYGMGATQNSLGLAYPFITYKSQDGKYSYTSLSQLNQCLNELSMRYKRSLASISSDYSTQSDTFLYPGYVCHLNKP